MSETHVYEFLITYKKTRISNKLHHRFLKQQLTDNNYFFTNHERLYLAENFLNARNISHPNETESLLITAIRMKMGGAMKRVEAQQRKIECENTAQHCAPKLAFCSVSTSYSTSSFYLETIAHNITRNNIKCHLASARNITPRVPLAIKKW